MAPATHGSSRRAIRSDITRPSALRTSSTVSGTGMGIAAVPSSAAYRRAFPLRRPNSEAREGSAWIAHRPFFDTGALQRCPLLVLALHWSFVIASKAVRVVQRWGISNSKSVGIRAAWRLRSSGVVSSGFGRFRFGDAGILVAAGLRISQDFAVICRAISLKLFGINAKWATHNP